MQTSLLQKSFIFLAYFFMYYHFYIFLVVYLYLPFLCSGNSNPCGFYEGFPRHTAIAPLFSRVSHERLVSIVSCLFITKILILRWLWEVCILPYHKEPHTIIFSIQRYSYQTYLITQIFAYEVKYENYDITRLFKIFDGIVLSFISNHNCLPTLITSRIYIYHRRQRNCYVKIQLNIVIYVLLFWPVKLAPIYAFRVNYLSW